MDRFSFAAGPLLLALLGVVVLPVCGPAPAAAQDQQGYLGVMLQDLSPSMTKALQLGDRSGVLVNEVVKDSPAQQAGVEAGDVIVEFAGAKTPDAQALTSAVRDLEPGAKAKITVLRDGKQKTFDVALGAQPEREIWIDKEAGELSLLPDDDRDVRIFLGDDDEQGIWTVRKRLEAVDRGYLGVHLDGLNDQLGEFFGVKDGKGALVTEVVKDSPAAAAGLKAGDVVVELQGEPIDSPDALHEAMAETDPDQQIKVAVLRHGKRQDVQVTLGEMPPVDMSAVHMSAADMHAKMPMMLRRLHEDGDSNKEIREMEIRPGGGPHRQIEIRRLGPDAEEFEQLQKDMQELREQLDQLRQELRK